MTRTKAKSGGRMTLVQAVQIAVGIAAWLGDHRGVPAPTPGLDMPPMYRFLHRTWRRRWVLHVIAAGWALARAAGSRRALAGGR